MKDLCNISSTSSSNQTITSSTSSSTSTTSKTVSSTVASSTFTNQMNGISSTVSSSNSIIQNDEDETVEYMEVEENTYEEPSSSQQFELSDIPQLVKRPLRLGDYWYIVDKKWYDSCLAYIEDETNPFPGKIDNSSLLVPVKNNSLKNYREPMYRLKQDLSENFDYVVVPEEVWNLFVENFSFVEGIGGNPIRCPVLEKGKSYLIVEIYPLELRLALYGSKEDMVVQFSQNCTLRQIVSDMRSLFSVNENRPVQLWNNATLLVAHSQNASSASTSSTISSSTLSNNFKVLSSTATSAPSSTNSDKSRSGLDRRLLDLELTPNTVLTLELQNLDGTWPSSRTKMGAITRSKVAAGVPVTHPGICGLMNFGNTCFMNSAIQCLSNTEPLTNFFLSDRHLEDINPDNPLGMRGEIARCYSEIIKGMWSGHHVNLTPREFKMAVTRFAPQFSGFVHQDCQELMAFLLDGLHEDLNRVKAKPYIEMKNDIERRPDEIVAKESWSNYKLRNDSIIVDTFHAQLKSTLVCPECNLVSVTFDPFCYLTLPLPYKNERAVDIIFIPAISKRPSYTPQKSMFRFSNSSCTQVSSSTSSDTSLLPSTSNQLPVRSILLENVMVPKIGSISEICAAVCKVLNESCNQNGNPFFEKKFDPKRLSVANVCTNRLIKIFNMEESYNSLPVDIVVYEEDEYPVSSATSESGCQTRSIAKSHGYHLPVFIRESSSNSNEILISRPFLINVKHLIYEDIQAAIFKELVSLVAPEEVDSFIQALNEEDIKEDKVIVASSTSRKNYARKNMATSIQDGGSDGEGSEIDEEDSQSNLNVSNSMDDDDEYEDEGVDASGAYYNTRNSRNMLPNPPFSITVVNLHANNEFSTLRPGVRLDSAVDTYLAVNINTQIVSKYLPRDINKHGHVKLSTLLATSAASFSPKSAISLDECIKQFTLTEKLGADDPWYCPRCKKHQMASKKFDIWSLPNNLIIHLKRFSYSRIHREKLDVLVEFPIKNLDMTHYVLHNPNNESFIYNLTGVSNHYGGLGAGHYNAYAKNFINNVWYLFDDSSVTPVTEGNVMTKSAYVLFYQRQQTNEQTTAKEMQQNSTVKTTTDSS